MKIIHVEKIDNDMGMVLSGGKGSGDGNIVLADVNINKSAAKLVFPVESRLIEL